MGKEKIRKIEIGMLYGDWQEVFINDNSHAINIYWSSETVKEELSKYYDLSNIKESKLEELF